MNIKKQSKFLSLVLRHKPETIALTLELSGWALVSDILIKCNMSITELEVIVEQNDKKRFEFNEDRTKIRASQGHSIDVDLDYVPTVPPKLLYHGTSNGAIHKILASGIKKMERHHVHLSADRETAIEVGKRKGDASVLTVRAQEMYLNGYKFFQSTNGVWLTKHVPEKYLNGIDLKQYYHDIHCNAFRHEPMGCPECSCYMNLKLITAQTHIKELEKEKAPFYTDHIKDLEKKIVELQTIVDRLDKTKDNVPIVEGDVVWFNFHEDTIDIPIEGEGIGWIGWEECRGKNAKEATLKRSVRVSVEDGYSTKEVAIAARKDKEQCFTLVQIYILIMRT